MTFSLFDSAQSQQVITLFTNVFSDSEGEAEGELIGNLVAELMSTTASQELVGFVARSDEEIIGSIFFSRFMVPNNKMAFLLAPVAIATHEQQKRLGQQLICYGIRHLKATGVDWLFTYGDPNFYSKVGFSAVSEAVVSAPYTLSHPEGWLAQSLDASPITALQGATKCVEAFMDPQYW